MSAVNRSSLLRRVAVFIVVFSSIVARGQDILQHQLDGTEQGKSLAVFFEELEKSSKVRVYFITEWIEPISFQRSYAGMTLEDALSDLMNGTDLSFIAMYPDALVIIKDPTQALLRKRAIEEAVKQNQRVDTYRFGDRGKARKGRLIISGQVTGSRSLDPIPRVNIQVSDTERGTTTDESGKYVLSLEPGVHVLTFSSIEYETKVIDLLAYEDGVIDFIMEESGVMLDEVVIHGNFGREVTTGKVGLTRLSMVEVKRAPALLGEVDLVKQVQTLPGVTTAGEAAAGFNVRGGSVDQNLILYDDMPSFNSSHVLGFFSAFNSEAIKDVSFYKGGVPAEYGGRTSSVLDIRSRDGDFRKWNGNVGIGLATSNFMINGPIKKDTTSVAVSFRTTYSDWLVRSIETEYADLSKSSVSFYDATMKLTHLFNSRTRLSVTGYSSNDAMRLVGDSTYQWNNLQFSAKLSHQFTEKLNSEFVAGVGSYGYSVENPDYLTASKLSFRINTILAKAAFNYPLDRHNLNFGLQMLHYRFSPGTLTPGSPASNAESITLEKQYSIENSLYVGDELTVNDRILIEGGIRLPVFISLGPATVKLYDPQSPLEVSNVSDSLNFGTAQPIETYVGIEPRLSFRWKATESSSIKFGYNRMYQYLNLVTNTTAVTPVDIWLPSGYYIKPQRADQVSIGYFTDLRSGKYAVSVEAFYKALDNIVDFKDGAKLVLNPQIETDLLQGKGTAYGVEMSITKNTGRLTGNVNYTYSRSFRQVAGPTSSESVNSGNQYPSNFDQPHIANLAWKYSLSRRLFFTGNFTYHTGRPVSIPLSAFQFENNTIAYFSGRNQHRIPDYHRLDLALIIEGHKKRKKKGEGSWVISVYNVYGRNNPYTVFFKSSGAGIPQPYQLSIIGSPLPSISYNYRF